MVRFESGYLTWFCEISLYRHDLFDLLKVHSGSEGTPANHKGSRLSGGMLAR